MINFIIEDNYNNAVEIKSVIESYMMNYDIEVKYHLFYNYNEQFIQEVRNIKGFKVFIINNEIDNNSGLKIANLIRKGMDDWNSIIIFTCKNNDSRYIINDKRLYIFDCIIKTLNYKKTILEDLRHIIKIYDNREKCLTIESNRIINKIDFKSINMIIKEKDSKRCIIKAEHGNYYTPEPLNKVSKRLDNRFVKISRSCIVNADSITEYNKNENKLTLKNGIISFDISRDYKKKLSNFVINYK